MPRMLARLLFSGRSTPPRGGVPGCPGTAFPIFGQNANPPPGGWVQARRAPENFLRPFVWEWVKFWAWVGQNTDPWG